MKIRDYIEQHNLYDEGRFCLLYEEFLMGDRDPKIWRHTISMTLDLECRGRLLAARGDANSVGDIVEFVKKILQWGGRTGNIVRGGLLPSDFSESQIEAQQAEIAEAVKEAARHLQSGNLPFAIKAITGVKGLGLSYGSKILRMLSPQRATTYDGWIGDFLSYPMTHRGWDDFCSDCKAEAGILKDKGIKNRFRIDGEWYVADVEAAIFRHVDIEREKEERKK